MYTAPPAPPDLPELILFVAKVHAPTPSPASPVFRDAALFIWLEENMDRLLARDVEATAYAIERSCINKVRGGGKGESVEERRGSGRCH